MLKLAGFNLTRESSQVPGGGLGVFLSAGKAERGSLVALYPGTVYYPTDPIFFQSINNQFMFRCSDGVHIDGKDRGLSKSIFKSCVNRDRFGHHLIADTSWLTPSLVSPLNIGQYVNNRSSGRPANVAYHEMTIPADFPIHLRKYIPNISYRTVFLDEAGNFPPLKIVGLVATRLIQEGDELYSTYISVVDES
ncbi:hypothetical protein QYM36_001670 [Artemia franciscana]|uniref:SET domain-containing protein n=2 Tax=Artemia franciscana TaxID=6661 RepID=A0AA88LBJ6_ARTSF|nr:hypothetical protein QYM36_001670 [Artemia franciscana]